MGEGGRGQDGRGERVRPISAPAYSRDSAAVRLAEVDALEGITPQWAWGGATGAGVRVAIVDSGIEADHPAVGDAVDVDEGLALAVGDDGKVVEQRGPHDDLFGHGTACAGIIHALAPEARLTSIRVLDESLTGRSNVFLHGLAWAIEQGFDVVNLSLGTTRRDWALAFYEVCDRAYFQGALVVTAAANARHPSYPSMYSAVTSVACNRSTDPRRFHYNPEPPVEFLARGIEVEVAWKGGATITATGNSYAAPHIAGLAALIRSKHPMLRPFQVKSVLWATAANVREAVSPGDEPIAAGRLTTATAAVPASTRATAALRAVAQGLAEDHSPA